jgi:hypothetical protein
MRSPLASTTAHSLLGIDSVNCSEYALMMRNLQFTPRQVAQGKDVVEVREYGDRKSSTSTQVFIQEGNQITKFVVESEEDLLRQVEDQLELGRNTRMGQGAGWQSIKLTRKTPQNQDR